MSFRWTRDGQTLVSVCVLCATTITGRRDNDVTFAQRAHSWQACQEVRAQTARAGEDEVPDLCRHGHERAGNTHVDSRGWIVCDACRREQYAAKRHERQAS